MVELKVNKITSLKHVLGYPHYSLGFCKVGIKNHPNFLNITYIFLFPILTVIETLSIKPCTLFISLLVASVVPLRT